MIVEIVRDKDKFDPNKGKEIETIEVAGDIIFPYFLNCLSMKWTKKGLRIVMLDDYKIKWSYDDPEKLWIIGDSLSDRNTINKINIDDVFSDREKKYKGMIEGFGNEEML